MKKAIIGKKVGMTQIFDETGKVIPVTVIEAGPCVVVQKMTKEKEGYEAVQFGYEEVTEKKLSQPEQGHLKKAGVGMVKHLKEFQNWAFALAFTSIGLETNFKELCSQVQGGKPFHLYIVGQLFNLVLTFAVVWLLLSGRLFPVPVLAA